MASYLPILYFAIMAAIVPVAGLAAMSLLRPSKPTPTKLAPYECGVASPTEAFDHRFSVRYYLIAVLFVVFDVETIFL
ncbi:MAG: NADH-quinone oxidoreductase subunit A, partial [Thermoanaerobaculia bacterium]